MQEHPAEIEKKGLVVGHSRFDTKDDKGVITRTSYSVDACFEMGKLPVTLYIEEDQAKDLVRLTGNSFDFQTIRDNGFTNYSATVGLSTYTGEKITKNDRTGRQKARGDLKVGCDYVTPQKKS